MRGAGRSPSAKCQVPRGYLSISNFPSDYILPQALCFNKLKVCLKIRGRVCIYRCSLLAIVYFPSSGTKCREQQAGPTGNNSSPVGPFILPERRYGSRTCVV